MDCRFMMDILYTGDETQVVFALADEAGPLAFADLEDLEVCLTVNKVEAGTFAKSSADPARQVVAGDEPDECLIEIDRELTQALRVGLMEAYVTIVFTDPDFPDGRKDTARVPLFTVKEKP